MCSVKYNYNMHVLMSTQYSVLFSDIAIILKGQYYFSEGLEGEIISVLIITWRVLNKISKKFST